MSIVIQDNFQSYIQANFPDLHKYHLIADVILFCLIAYTYYFGTPELYTKIIKYTVIIFIVRYICNSITNYTKLDNDNDNETIGKETVGKETIGKNYKNYFQLNGHVAIFALIILTNSLLDLNNYTTIAILIGYTLFVSAVNYGYTVDNLITLVLTYNLVNLY